jgi:hypothetical protein
VSSRYDPPSATLEAFEPLGSPLVSAGVLGIALVFTASVAFGAHYVSELLLASADVTNESEWDRAWYSGHFLTFACAFVSAAIAGFLGRLAAGPLWIQYAPFAGLGFVAVEAYFQWARYQDLLDFNLAIGFAFAIFVGPALVLAVLASVTACLYAGVRRRRRIQENARAA